MQTVLDMIFSALIGGLILLSVHSLNNTLANAAAEKTVTTEVQENIAALTDILEYDLRKTGYNNFGSAHFKMAESSRVYVRGDFNNDGNPDSVFYYLGSSPDLLQNNPRSRILYRSYNGGPATAIRLGITRFRLWYYDAADLPLATTPGVSDISAVVNIKVALDVSVGSVIETLRQPNGTTKRDTTFSYSSWKKMIHPVNLK